MNHNLSDSDKKSKEPIDIVLFGSFIQRFLETGNLPSGDYRFWALSSAVKKVYTDLLGFPAESISIIPRNSLFPLGEEKHLTGDTFDLVHAGRISPVKNMEMFLLFAYYLQKDHQVKCRPVLFGDFDDIQHDHHGRILQKDYRHFIQTICSSLEWDIEPKFMGLYPSNEWSQHKELNSPVYCTFSTYSKEDFGVSVAQAQANGWPLILSAWGGHLDCSGQNIYKIPLERIGESIDELVVIKGKARALARDFVSSKESFISSGVVEPPQLPAPLSVSQLDQIRRKVVSKWGNEIQYITRQMTDHYADSQKGLLFFQQFNKLFSIQCDSPKTILILHDFNLELYNKPDEYLKKIEQLAFEISSLKSHLEIMVSRDVTKKAALAKLMKSQQILLINDEYANKTQNALSLIIPRNMIDVIKLN